MKKVTLLIASIIISLSSFAQLSVGLRGGLNLSNIALQNKTSTSPESNTKTGTSSGIVVNYGFSDRLSAQVELLYARKGCKYHDVVLATTYDAKVKLNYFEIPILFRYSIGNENKVQAFVNAGPYLGFRLKALYEQTSTTTIFGSTTTRNSSTDFTNDVHNTDIGLNGGIGVNYALELGKLFTEIRYGYGLTNVNKTVTNNVTEHNSNLQFIFGFMYPIGL